jgi:CxxC motif-containing protein (DUF1111 family)
MALFAMAGLLCASGLSQATGGRDFPRPDPVLGRAERLDFKVGCGLFERLWVSRRS